ncbi:MAG: cyclic nucleotide-binding domain-containing protein, partial [Myxococcales bacterium]|nr:cyclic nucleotide-binding domain-containing protein [Myxococcales bacterium]
MSIFDGLNDIDAATARRRFRTHNMRAGDVLTRAGDVGRGLAIVEQGSLEVEVAGAVVGTIGVGGMLGEAGLFADGRRMATVRATQPTVLSLLTREGYEELRDTVHPICIAIERVTLANQVQRLRSTGQRVAQLGLGVPSAVRPTNAFFAAVARLFGSGEIAPTDGDALDTLLASALFHGAPRPAVEPIAGWFQTLSCRSGAFLCTEGEEGESMFLLESGLVEVLVSMDGTPQQVATLEPG